MTKPLPSPRGTESVDVLDGADVDVADGVVDGGGGGGAEVSDTPVCGEVLVVGADEGVGAVVAGAGGTSGFGIDVGLGWYRQVVRKRHGNRGTGIPWRP